MASWNIFDHYSLRARLQPALIVLMPLALGVFAWVGTKKPWMSTIWTLLGTAGVTFLFAALVRNRGKQVESKLWASWGGSPTTLLLRHRGPSNAVLRERWHRQLTKFIGRDLPTHEQEIGNPKAADDVYEAATRLLIGKTRDAKKYSLLYKENVQYGFCRNLYAMRGLGAVASILGIIVSARAFQIKL